MLVTFWSFRWHFIKNWDDSEKYYCMGSPTLCRTTVSKPVAATTNATQDFTIRSDFSGSEFTRDGLTLRPDESTFQNALGHHELMMKKAIQIVTSAKFWNQRRLHTGFGTTSRRHWSALKVQTDPPLWSTKTENWDLDQAGEGWRVAGIKITTSLYQKH